MEAKRSDEVRSLYERYPFPHGTTRSAPDYAYASTWFAYFQPHELAGCSVLEAGCGTGNKVAALGQMYPEASFVGIDLSAQSVECALELLAKHSVKNVEIERADILALEDVDRFDVIQAVGVVHHTADPQLCLANLTRALKKEGVMLIWLYHPLGEFDRLTKRKLLHTLWGLKRDDLCEGERLMKALGLTLEEGHYGPRKRDSDILEGDADAFMHPLVEAYDFSTAMEMLARAGCDWAAIDFINIRWGLKFVNLDAARESVMGEAGPQAAFRLPLADVLPESLHDRFRAMSRMEQLQVIELSMRPRGYLVVAGRGDSHTRFDPRIQGSRIDLGRLRSEHACGLSRG
jgi:SAM-dependent methyltransferase